MSPCESLASQNMKGVWISDTARTPHPAPDARGDAAGLAGDARRLPDSQIREVQRALRGHEEGQLV